jgi:hypothetical protein
MVAVQLHASDGNTAVCLSMACADADARHADVEGGGTTAHEVAESGGLTLGADSEGLHADAALACAPREHAEPEIDVTAGPQGPHPGAATGASSLARDVGDTLAFACPQLMAASADAGASPTKSTEPAGQQGCADSTAARVAHLHGSSSSSSSSAGNHASEDGFGDFAGDDGFGDFEGAQAAAAAAPEEAAAVSAPAACKSPGEPATAPASVQASGSESGDGSGSTMRHFLALATGGAQAAAPRAAPPPPAPPEPLQVLRDIAAQFALARTAAGSQSSSGVNSEQAGSAAKRARTVILAALGLADVAAEADAAVCAAASAECLARASASAELATQAASGCVSNAESPRVLGAAPDSVGAQEATSDAQQGTAAASGPLEPGSPRSTVSTGGAVAAEDADVARSAPEQAAARRSLDRQASRTDPFAAADCVATTPRGAPRLHVQLFQQRLCADCRALGQLCMCALRVLLDQSFRSALRPDTPCCGQPL